MQPPAAEPTYLLVDGENIDGTLGTVLDRRPQPEERPRWERVRDFAAGLWDQPVTALFFLNASSGQLPMGFVQALIALGYRPIPLAGDSNEKVVDIGIQRTLDAIGDRGGDVLLASHDADFVEHLRGLLRAGRKVGLVGFREYASLQFAELEAEGLRFCDLEHDVGGFDTPLPRVRIIPIDEFDPADYL